MRFLLVRHASPVMPNTVGFTEMTRPLTEIGSRDAALLALSLESEKNIVAVYSSPMRRAIQTVEAIAQARGLEVIPIAELVEHLLSPEPITNWQEVLKQSWSDFHYALAGAETMLQTQTRGLAVLEQLRLRHPIGDVVIGGHGTIFSLILHHFQSKVDFDFHLAMPMPALYEIEFVGAECQNIRGYGF
jgi:2,3-bisphosphoglycerate-dependent phosphoglycerate mutase